MAGMISPSPPNVGNPVLTQDPASVYNVFQFRLFRLNVIGFLKQPLGVSESALRDVIKGCSANLLAHNVARAELAREELARAETRARRVYGAG